MIQLKKVRIRETQPNCSHSFPHPTAPYAKEKIRDIHDIFEGKKESKKERTLKQTVLLKKREI